MDLEQVAVNPKKHDPAWKHCEMYKSRIDGKVQLKCIYCSKMFKGGGIHRIKEHLAGHKGNGTTCLHVHPDVRLLMHHSLNGHGIVKNRKKKQKLANETDSFDLNYINGNDNNDNEDVLLTVTANESVDPSGSVVSNDKTSVVVGRRKKGGRVRKGSVSLAIGRFLFDVGVSLDAVNSVHFQPMIDAIASQGSGVVGPTYHDMRGWILKNMVQEVRGDVDQCMGTLGKTGCSILVDECRSENGRTFLNFSVYCPQGLVFLRSVDGTNILDSTQDLFSLFKEVVQEVGVKNVLQIITNNEARYVEVGKEIADNFPAIFWTPCATECVDLILEDFRELEWINSVLEQARSISRFIYSHSLVLEYDEKRMVSVKHNLQSMVASDEWMEYPLLRLRRIVSCKKTPGMGYVYAGVYRAKEAIKKELVDKKNYMVYWNIIDRRWGQLHRHPLHMAGFYLNPKFFYSTEGDIHYQIRLSVYDCVEKLILDTKIQDKIMRETASYREAAGDFGRKIAIRGRNTLCPAEWWSTYGGACPNMLRFAIRILSQTCSLVRCMPNNIPFQQMHETKNYVEYQRLSDIVFVKYNMRLKQMLMNKEQDNPDPFSYDNIKSVEAWVTEREIHADDVGSSDWMTVEPPLGPQVDDIEALGEGFGDQEIFDGLKDGEDENGENNVQL
ncbi:hAT transposon superfamily [Artemisia annua]|uniref:HAT transposon superfamily n=1 Tax=Artemisia annua TaxID=35608 RepID=A0A2U1MJ98_ARTAN|nr:hAT transposon superfamily [Artemisia annua]